MIGTRRESKLVSIVAITVIPLLWSFLAATNAGASDSDYELKRFNLPGATGAVALDYFAYDGATGKLWVPASNTGSVDVIDEKTDAVSQITGFPTGEIERRGKKITLGPTAASIGNGVVYVGNRGNATLCIINAKTFTRGECVPASPDRDVDTGWSALRCGYARALRSRHAPLWVATRLRQSLFKCSMLPIRSGSNGNQKFRSTVWQKATPSINERGLFYTNMEEPGKTVAIDVRSHKIVAEWNPGSSDLQGLALDSVRRFLFIACGDHVVSIDAGHDGKVVDSIKTGAGLDNIDYSADAKVLYAAASQAATLTIAEVGNDGKFHLKATVPTAKGARGVVAGKGDTAYLIDPAEGRILKLIRK